MFFCFGIKPDGVEEGEVCRPTAPQPEPAQTVAMRCGCIFIYVQGERFGLAHQCWEHIGAWHLIHCTIINAELPCCRN